MRSELERIVIDALKLPTLTGEELRFLLRLHLRIISPGSQSPTDAERTRLNRLISDHTQRKWADNNLSRLRSTYRIN